MEVLTDLRVVGAVIVVAFVVLAVLVGIALAETLWRAVIDDHDR